MNRFQMLVQTRLVAVGRFDHPEHHEHRDPKEEIAPVYSINFVEEGTYRLHGQGKQWRMSTEAVFVSRPGLVYRCFHDEPIPTDRCLSVIYSPSVAEDFEKEVAASPWSLAPMVRLTNRLAYLRHRLSCVAEVKGEAIELDSLAAEMVRAVLEGNPNERKRFKPRQLPWYAERIDAARTLLETRYFDKHSLESLSRDLGMSPFHFARIFRELVGVPPHRYLLNVRLGRAAEMLRSKVSVTETCYGTGFDNLSHFIRSFRGAYSVSPSRFRD